VRRGHEHDQCNAPLVLDEGEQGQMLLLAHPCFLARLCQAKDDAQRQVVDRLLALEKITHAIAVGSWVGVAAYDHGDVSWYRWLGP
jgi:hypothetical protein